MKADHRVVVKQVRRIEGQVRGLIGMVEQDRYCLDIRHQLSAVRAALGEIENQVLEVHAATCVEEVMRSGTADEQQAKFEELVRLFGRIKK